MSCLRHLAALAMPLALTFASHGQHHPSAKTTISIQGDQFFINEKVTYEGRAWDGKLVEGLLMNSRMVQGIFDDLNPETRPRWNYPDGDAWDPERNTAEFVEQMATWRNHGLLSFTINLQGGSPEGYSSSQPWHNSAIASDGSLRADYLKRLEWILRTADDLGMVPILGLFYFGQDERLENEASILHAVDSTMGWLVGHGFQNVLVEINNECNVRYDHPILRPDRVHELIERVKNYPVPRGRPRFLAGTSYGGNTIPGENVVRASDFILLHGNGVKDPARITEMVRLTRKVPGYTPKPILFNEDDHFDFDKTENNFKSAVKTYASWGYFDFRMKGEGFDNGFQSVPVNWGISSARKKGFFALLAEITGSTPANP